MKLGIGLPTGLVPALNRGLLLDWCRASDQAGFHVFGASDRPDYDSWEPLTALTAAAAVTERVRLATTILQLPARNEVLVAKQAAVIDRLSGGRFDLGIALGARERDYKALRARFPGRDKKIERQVRKIRRVWRAAKKSNDDTGLLGPAPLQKSLPPIWLGGGSESARTRAATIGDGWITPATPEDLAAAAPGVRAQAEENKRRNFQIIAVARCAIGDDATAALEAGSRAYLRAWDGEPPRPAADAIIHGPAEVLAHTAKEYEQAGADILIVFPMIPDVKQVEMIAQDVLPAYRIPS